VLVELPSGAVTFLFTDIEGSTRLLKQLRERYAEVLGEHHRLLRTAFAAHEGHEVDTQGDAFFVAFSRARDAVLAAVDGQLALLTHEWPEGAQVRVRMGIHTGQAAASNGRYTGLAVHRAARICAAGHGGQVLVSQATQTLIEDEEEELQISLRDLGVQRLKDLDRPVRLYQVTAPALPADFPPPRTAETAARSRRTRVLLALGLSALAAIVAAVSVLATRGGGTVTVKPNSVALIDAKTSKVVGQVPVGSGPGPIAVGGSSAWVANVDDKTVSQLDPRTRTVEHSVSLTETPTGIAVGAGAVWIANGRRGDLTRVDPQFSEATTLHRVAGILTGESRGGAVALGEGAVWAAYGSYAVVRVSPTAKPRVLASSFAGRSPAAIAVGEGSIWVANRGDNSVSQFDPDTFADGAIRKLQVGRGPTAVTVGGGYVWVANTVDGTVQRYDPKSQGSATIPDVGTEPIGIAYGAGAVWVANSGDGTVSRIDPATSDVRRIHVGNSPNGIAFGGGLVWVTVTQP
jgi:YVTN family beta-propeller protein